MEHKNTERLQKFISDSGVMSRRAAEREIAAGSVTVNGRPAKIGQSVDPSRDRVCVAGRFVEPRRSKYTYIMLNKPAGFVTTMSDEKGRKCVAALVSDVGERVYPIGRLDYESEGLLLMTSDGELANALMHPSTSLPKVYTVRVDTMMTDEQFKMLTSPMEIDGYRLRPIEAAVTDIDEDYTVLRVTLHEGRNRQIRKMCEQAGLNVTRLRRTSIGDIGLDGLRPGKWRVLSAAQIDYLKTSATPADDKRGGR
ncbi:MAG: pseudouridine synthase [Eubacteriales bacterium]